MKLTYRQIVPTALLFVLPLLAYIPALSGDWIWDDDLYVTHNPTLGTAAGLARIWTEPQALPQYYPLVHTTFWIEYHLWGLDPAGYHFNNVLLHALGALVLWRVLVRLEVPGAWLAAALFSVHPVEVESVAWISERKNVLSELFYFLALLTYLRCRPFVSPSSSDALESQPAPIRTHRKLYALAIVLFICALLSKTVVATLPAAILVIIWWKQGRISRWDVLRVLPMFVMGILAGLYTAHLERAHVGALGEEWNFSFAERCLIAGKAVWFYAAKVVWPVNLTFFYPQWKIDVGDWRQWMYPVSAVGLVITLFLLRRRIGRGPLVAVLIFGGTLFPALGFLNVYPMRYSFVADHFQYLASAALITLFASGATTSVGRWFPILKQPLLKQTGGLDDFLSPAGILGGLIVVVLAALTMRQTLVYADLETLWTDTIRKNPECWMAHNNLGELLQARRVRSELVRAESHYRRAIEIRPEAFEAHNNLGSLYLVLDRLDRAEREFREALRINPDYASAHLNYGKLYYARKEWDQAVRAFERALEADPNFVDAYYNLGSILLQMQQPDNAVEPLEQAVRLDPYYVEAYNLLGNALAETQQYERAGQSYARAIALNPNYVPAYTGIAGVLIFQGNLADAERFATIALKMDPQNPIARRELLEISRRTRVQPQR